MSKCNCQEENSLLKKEKFKNYMLFLLIAIIIGLFLIYRNCGK